MFGMLMRFFGKEKTMINSPKPDRISDRSAMSQNVPECPNENRDVDRLGFTDRQRLALDLILQGKSLSKVAKCIGIDRRTLFRWRHHDRDFIAELNRRRELQWDGLT